MKAKDEELCYGESIAEAPRWSGLPSRIKNLAWVAGVNCEIESEKGWFREYIRFRVNGTKSQMVMFKDSYMAMMGKYGPPSL